MALRFSRLDRPAIRRLKLGECPTWGRGSSLDDTVHLIF